MSLATPLSCQKLIINGLLSSLGCQFFTPLEYCKDVIQRKVIGKGPPSIGKKTLFKSNKKYFIERQGKLSSVCCHCSANLIKNKAKKQRRHVIFPSMISLLYVSLSPCSIWGKKHKRDTTFHVAKVFCGICAMSWWGRDRKQENAAYSRVTYGVTKTQKRLMRAPRTGRWGRGEYAATSCGCFVNLFFGGNFKKWWMYFRRRGSVAECLNHPWIAPKSVGDIRLRQSNQINMDNFRNFQVGIGTTAGVIRQE